MIKKMMLALRWSAFGVVGLAYALIHIAMLLAGTASKE